MKTLCCHVVPRLLSQVCTADNASAGSPIACASSLTESWTMMLVTLDNTLWKFFASSHTAVYIIHTSSQRVDVSVKSSVASTAFTSLCKLLQKTWLKQIRRSV